MGFKRVGGTPNIIVGALDGAATYYVGQLVKSSTGEGWVAAGTASGANDTSQGVAANCFGIIVGFDERVPTYDSTYKTDKVTTVITPALQAARNTNYLGPNSWGGVGDKMVKAQIDMMLCPKCDVIEGPFYNATFGVAPTLLTVTGASADGGVTGPTTNAAEVAGVLGRGFMYCRTGANAGSGRVTNDTSTTVPEVVIAFPNAVIAVGDTFVRVPCRPGHAFLQFDSVGMFLNSAATAATNYYAAFVRELDLAIAGKEVARFSLLTGQFA